MNKRKFKLASSTAIIAFAALQALPMAVAQTSPAAEDENGRDVVVVTASRREENVQDTPLNIAAVGGAQIEEQGFGDIADVLAYVPGINLVDRGGRQGNPIIVRGLNADLQHARPDLGPGDYAALGSVLLLIIAAIVLIGVKLLGRDFMLRRT